MNDEPRSLISMMLAECDRKMDERREEKRRLRELSPAELGELAQMAEAVAWRVPR